MSPNRPLFLVVLIKFHETSITFDLDQPEKLNADLEVATNLVRNYGWKNKDTIAQLRTAIKKLDNACRANQAL